MTMTFPVKPLALAAALVLALPLSAEAHRSWMLPSATVLSGQNPWVTVDAAVSNDLFYFEHNALKLDGLTVTQPDGTPGKVENASTGKYRSTFDVQLGQPGTYKLALANDGLFASYKQNGQQKRWRGTVEALAKEIPADATDVTVTRSQRRLEVFVTAGKPTDTVLKPTGKGLELVPVTHPNDLMAGEPAKFRFTIDGKPAEGVKITVIPGGIRYRDKLHEQTLTSGKDGEVAVTWGEPGMYWMSASFQDEKSGLEMPSKRNASYTATFEVLPQ